jgi:hypothetical protein
MKTIIGLLAATFVVAGASSAIATEFQDSDEAASYALSHATGWSFGGAYGSARVPGPARNSTIGAPIQMDFQAGGNN